MATTEKKRLVLLDAHAIIHRAYHALPDFSSSKGEPTGALYGLIAMLIKIVETLKPDYVAACYDLPGKTFRHEAYEDYKAGRKEADGELIAQLIRSREVFTAFNVPMYEHPGFEADDMLGTITEQFKNKKEVEIIIASGDMDTLQLVDKKHVQVYTLRKGLSDTIMYDEEEVKKRFGFGPELLPDYKGLRGDPSDNIVGIRGIGEKTATDLIQNFGSIEEIYTTLKKSPKKLEEKVKPRIVELLKNGEEEAIFSKTLATIRRDAPVVFTFPAKRWEESLDGEAIEKLCGDMEFRTLWTRLKKVFGLEGAAEDVTNKETPPTEEELREISIAVWLLNSELTNPGMDDILQYAGAKSFADAKKKVLEELKAKKLEIVYQEIELPIVPLVQKMKERGILIDKKYFTDLSEKYHIELSKLENDIYALAGESFNINSPKQLSAILFDKMGLVIKGMKKTAGGARSTRESELAKLKDEHEIIAKILSYRELQKLLSTYIDNLPHLAGEDGRLHADFFQAGTTTGRFSSQNPNLQNIPIKSELGQAIRNGFIAEKGYTLAAFDYSQIELRFAAILSKDPTLIKIFEEGKDVHTAVAARVFGVLEDKVDYEMRRRAKVINFGIIYGMGVNALRENLGGTRAEAEEFYNQYFERFPRVAEYLEETKAFAMKYGYTETLFGRRRYFPALKSHLPYIRAMAERMATNAPIQGTATADVIKLAIRDIAEQLKKEGLDDKVFLLLQIHDELIFEIKNEVIKEATALIKKTMENVLPNSFLKFKTTVPLAVEGEVGKNWGEMEKI